MAHTTAREEERWVIAAAGAAEVAREAATRLGVSLSGEVLDDLTGTIVAWLEEHDS